MNTKEILNQIEKVDKKIMDIYELIKNKEIYSESYENEKYELNNLIMVEDYLYSKLTSKLSSDKLYEKLCVYDYKITKSKLTFDDLIEYQQLNLYNNKKDKNIIEQFIYIRIYNKLFNLCNIDKLNSDLDSNKYVDELTDIYVPDNIKTYINLSQEKYIKKAMSKKERVFAFNDKVKKELIDRVYLDMSIIRIIFLEIGLEETINSGYYIEEIYGEIFINKNLEKKVLSCDFDIDKLFEEIYLKEDPKTSNQKFYYWYRSRNAFIILENLLIIFSSKFKDNDFLPNNPYYLFNQTKYEIYLLIINAYMMLLNVENYEQFKLDSTEYIKKLKNTNGMSNIANNLSANISEENYQKLKKIMYL